MKNRYIKRLSSFFRNSVVTLQDPCLRRDDRKKYGKTIWFFILWLGGIAAAFALSLVAKGFTAFLRGLFP